MSRGCPFCGNNEADSELNFQCPKCGKAFWNSREAFEKQRIKNHNEQKEPSDRTITNKRKPKKEPKLGIKRIVICLYSAEFFSKGVLSGFIAATFSMIISANHFSDELSTIPFYFLLIYWISITVGYGYGYQQYINRKKPFNISDKILFTISLFILICILYLLTPNIKTYVNFIYWLLVAYAGAVMFGFFAFAIRYMFTLGSRKNIIEDCPDIDCPEEHQISKIFCPKCGKRIDDDSNFCIFCGSEIINKKSE